MYYAQALVPVSCRKESWQAGSTGSGAVAVLPPVEDQACVYASCPGGRLNTVADLVLLTGGPLQRLRQWAMVPD